MNGDTASEASRLATTIRPGMTARFVCADLLAVAAVAALPWSTTGFEVLLAFWLLALIPLIPATDFPAFVRFLWRPICLLPLAIFLIAFVGTLWADAPWEARLLGIKPAVKLLAIPLLLYYFWHSRRGEWAIVAFLASCALLMMLSWIVVFAPELKLANTAHAGVPVKNRIDQSQEFALCMVALMPGVIAFYRQQSYVAAAGCAALVSGFFANMVFVVSARTALIYVPALLIIFASKHLSYRQSVLLFVGFVVTATTIWFCSPYLRNRVEAIATEYESYKQNIPLSTGQRLEYWQKSFRFFADAPILGNGTGSTETLFKRDAVGKTGLAAEVTKNPHNQTLNMGVQWGAIGIVALYGMWLAHLLFFRGGGFANWIGLLIVVQNMFSSLFNSHLFDFHAGWMYVLGVGIAGGMSLRVAGKPEPSHGTVPIPHSFKGRGSGSSN